MHFRPRHDRPLHHNALSAPSMTLASLLAIGASGNVGVGCARWRSVVQQSPCVSSRLPTSRAPGAGSSVEAGAVLRPLHASLSAMLTGMGRLRGYLAPFRVRVRCGVRALVPLAHNGALVDDDSLGERPRTAVAGRAHVVAWDMALQVYTLSHRRPGALGGFGLLG